MIHLKYIMWVYVLFAFTNCSVEDEMNRGGEEVENFIDLNVQSLDSEIKVRVILTNVQGVFITNEANLDLSKPYQLKVKERDYILYILANEPASITAILNGLSFDASLATLKMNRQNIPFFEITNANNHTNAPLFKRIPFKVRSSATDPHTLKVSTNGGSSWTESLNTELEKIAVKLSLKVRKDTQLSTDAISITKVQLLNVPLHFYWFGQVYREGLSVENEYAYNNSPGTGLTNTAEFTTVFENYMVPEYYPDPDDDVDKAITLVMYAMFNGAERIYTIPVSTLPDGNTYMLERNTHHTINATIVSQGEVVVNPGG